MNNRIIYEIPTFLSCKRGNLERDNSNTYHESFEFYVLYYIHTKVIC